MYAAYGCYSFTNGLATLHRPSRASRKAIACGPIVLSSAVTLGTNLIHFLENLRWDESSSERSKLFRLYTFVLEPCAIHRFGVDWEIST